MVGAEVALEALDLGAHLEPELGVQVRERLVHQERMRLADDRAGQRDPLALPAGELPRHTLEQVVDVEHPRHLGRARQALLAGHLPHPERVTDVVGHVLVRVEGVALEHHRDVAVLGLESGHVAIADQDATRRRLFQAGKDPKRRRLPAARGAEEGQERAVGDVQVEVGDGIHPTERL